jgi:glycosyltransferase involved in cell wall biosynthesis
MWDLTEGVRGNIAFLTLPYGYLPDGAKPETANRLLSQVWGCSNHVVQTLVEIGFDPAKVYRVPLGYAPDVFHPGVRAAILPTQKRCRFIHVSIPLVLTKGIDLLIRAYAQEFTEKDDTCLVLQSRPRASGEDTVTELIKKEMSAAGHQPEILLLATGADQPTLANWYAASSCYVQTSRCEGFGMPVLEAMACGLPAIATNWGGHLEMCNLETSYLVNCTVGGLPEGAEMEGVSSVRKWAEADLEQLRYWMRYVYEHPAEAHERGRSAAEWVRRRLTWEHAAREALSALCTQRDK